MSVHQMPAAGLPFQVDPVATGQLVAQAEAAVNTSRPRSAQTAALVTAYGGHGVSLHYSGRLDEAEDYYRRAVTLDPAQADVWSLLGMLQLSRHNADGWKSLHEFHIRDKIDALAPGSPPAPYWDGARDGGRRLLVRGFYGAGDAVHHWRYIPDLVAAGMEVTVEMVEPFRRLMPYFERSTRVTAIYPGDPAPPHDAFVWNLDLPYFAGATWDYLCGVRSPYIRLPDGPLRAAWRERIERSGSGLKVGLVWGVHPSANREMRSVPLAQFALLATVPSVRLFGLTKTAAWYPDWQKPADGGVEAEPSPEGMVLDRLGPDLNDFADTAATICEMDLVVTVDTVTAHIAGAMRKPVWLLLDTYSDWRWLENRRSTDWYPSMRLFRQRDAGDWAPVVQQVANDLRRLAEKRGAV